MPDIAPLISLRYVAAASTAALMFGCGGGSGVGSANAPTRALSSVAQLGERIFADPSLSASGSMSCQTCHEPNHAFASPANEPVPSGGPARATPGFRKAPSLRYRAGSGAFSFENDGAPVGGFDRDGRANSLAEQARRPFLAEHEMANATVTEVADKLSRTAYAAEFEAVFGARIFEHPELAFDRAVTALQQYQLEDPDFAPFTSKYDAFLRGKIRLSEAELPGLAVFNDAQKGNCAACHSSARGAAGEMPLFTDFSYDNLGVPRNPAIPANNDPDYFDLGLCGPFRDDLTASRDLCGAFNVPTLRNVAPTPPYFHNGRFATLTEAVRFYVRRDTDPQEWYPTDSDGALQKFDDLPPHYGGNVNVSEAPYNRDPGDVPALDAAEIADLVAFLDTLTDGFQQ
jgi:cytochrome c peroxidase